MFNAEVQLWDRGCVFKPVMWLSSWPVWFTPVTLMFGVRLIKDIQFFFSFSFFLKSSKYERERNGEREGVSREDKQTERSEFSTGLNFHAILLFPVGGQSHRKEQTLIAHFLGCSARSLKTHYKCILPACQHHKGETLSINSTRSREAFLFPLAFFFSV